MTLEAEQDPSPGGLAATPSPAPFGYEPALDGLRALAVTAVFAYHAGVDRLAGGFLGVDAFFVISGFLITTLLVRERASTGRIALRSFWARRVRRLLPAVLLLLVAVAAYGVLLAPKISLHSLRLDALATLAYVANWRFVWSHQSYFEVAAGPSPLRHTWSLAVEEQWYLVWPLVVSAALALVARRSGALRTGLLALGAGALAVASAIWMAVLTPASGDTSRAYFGTDTRAQGLLVGAAVALALHRWPLRRGRAAAVAAVLGVAGLVAGLALFATVDEQTRWLYHGGFLLAAVAWAAVVVATVQPVDGPVRWVLGRRPLVALGRISYGVYLWLWPAVVVLTPKRVGVHGWPLVGVQAVATLVAAVASYRLLEHPVRSGRWRSRAWWRPGALAGGAVTATAALVLAGTVGATSVPTGPARVGGGSVSHVTLVPRVTPSVPGLAPPAGASSPPPAPPGRTVSVAVVGDSVGFAMVWYAPPIAGLHVTTRAIPGCGVIDVPEQIGKVRSTSPTYCTKWLAEWTAAVASDPDVALVYLGGWEVFDPYVDGRRLSVGSPEWERYVTAQLERGLAILTRPARTRVGLVTVPCFRYELPVFGIPSDERNDPRRVAAVNRVLRAAAARHPGRVTLVDYASYACPGGRYREKVDGVVLRPDGMHTDAASTRVAWSWLAPIVLEMAHRPRL